MSSLKPCVEDLDSKASYSLVKVAVWGLGPVWSTEQNHVTTLGLLSTTISLAHITYRISVLSLL